MQEKKNCEGDKAEANDYSENISVVSLVLAVVPDGSTCGENVISEAETKEKEKEQIQLSQILDMEGRYGLVID